MIYVSGYIQLGLTVLRSDVIKAYKMYFFLVLEACNINPNDSGSDMMKVYLSLSHNSLNLDNSRLLWWSKSN